MHPGKLVTPPGWSNGWPVAPLNADPKGAGMEEEASEGAGPGGIRARSWLRWVERLFVGGVLIFAGIRLGPQIGALTGVGPTLGAAPEYAFTSLDGRSIDSSELSGKVVVLNFWATWCGPCRLEIPSLQALHEDREQDGVVVLGLSTDRGAQSDVVAYLAERNVTFPVGLATARIRRAFGEIHGIPTTFVIDREGVIRHRVVGYFAPPALRAAVARLVDS